MSRSLALGMAAALWLCHGSVAAQELSPRWTLKGRGLLSTPVVAAGAGDLDVDWVLADYADTHIATRLDQALFDDTIGAFALGARLTDRDSPVGPVYLYQVEAGVDAEHVEVRLGRTRRPILGIGFPTLRDEDLLTFLYPLNPYSVGGLEEDVLFSEVGSVLLRADFRWHAQLFIESLRNTTDTGTPAQAADFEPNAAGIRLFYDELPEVARIRRIKHAGVALYGARMGDRAPDVDRFAIYQLQGSLALNLYPDPIHLLDLRVLGLYQHGSEDETWTDVTDTWRGRYVSAAAALRYLWGSYQLDRFQASVAGGYRRYTERDAWELRVIPTAMVQLGVGVGLAFQYAYSRRSDTLNGATGEPRNEHRFELALSYEFEVMVNDTINTPRDILNADYRYIPVN